MKNYIIVSLAIFLCNQFLINSQNFDYSDFKKEELPFYFSALQSTYPDLISYKKIGYIEDAETDVIAYELSVNNNIPKNEKPNIVFISLMHAREWITGENLLYTLDKITYDYKTGQLEENIKNDIEKSRIWFIPVVNPAGYDVTNEIGNNYESIRGTPGTGDGLRFWRKNVRNNGDGSYGVDLNRNWSVKFEQGADRTTDDRYHGPYAFSEKETRVLRNFLESLNNLEVVITFHAFGGYYLNSWNYLNAISKGTTVLSEVSNRNIAIIERENGTKYRNFLYKTYGEMSDYFWQYDRIAVFTPELRPYLIQISDFEINDFNNRAEILRSNVENYDATLALIHDSADTEIYIKDHNSDIGKEPSSFIQNGRWNPVFWSSPSINVLTDSESLSESTLYPVEVIVENSNQDILYDVEVQLYYTDPSITLEFPDDQGTTLIDSKKVNLSPGSNKIRFEWTTPPGTNSVGDYHWCLGVVIKHFKDMPLTTDIIRSSNVACKNIGTIPVESGRSKSIKVSAKNFLDVPAQLDFGINNREIKNGWSIETPRLMLTSGSQKPSSLRKAKMLDLNKMILEPGEATVFELQVFVNNDVPINETFDLNIWGVLKPLKGGIRRSFPNGMTYRLVVK